MQVGLIGAGNMARAIARGWGGPVLCTDGGSGRAAALVAELGGEALRSNVELAERAELVVLCHKPYQLEAVAGEIAPHAKAVASILGGVRPGRLRQVYPDAPVFALMPNTPVELGRGVVVYAQADPEGDAVPDPVLEREVLELFGRLGSVVTLPERLIDVATAVSGVGPAYWALLVEAQVDAAVRHGLRAELAAQLVVETMAGSAALLARRGNDTLAVRREVTSPGGSTARGLNALAHAQLRAAFEDAIDAVLRPPAR